MREIEIPEGIAEIPFSLFQNCSGLLNINLPETITAIGNSAFNNCKSLEEIELPVSLKTIGDYAFANSGLNHISIPMGVSSLAAGTFDGSHLVYIDMEGVTTLSDNAFSGCPELMVINLSPVLKQVGYRSLDAVNLTAINAPQQQPATATADPFPGVDNKTCALAVPKPSFTQYLGAEYWGKFVSIRNSIDVTQVNYDSYGEEISEEDNAEDPASELTYMDEQDYQDMLEDLQQEQEDGNGDEPIQARRMALRIMRDKGLAAVNKGYGKLFNNASLFLDDASKTRFFIALAPDVSSFTVTYNGKDITSQVDLTTMSFVIDGLQSTANLVITTNGHVVESSGTSGRDSIGAFESNENNTYYNLNGQIVKNPTPGIYIHNGKKVIIR